MTFEFIDFEKNPLAIIKCPEGVKLNFNRDPLREEGNIVTLNVKKDKLGILGPVWDKMFTMKTENINGFNILNEDNNIIISKYENIILNGIVYELDTSLINDDRVDVIEFITISFYNR